MSYVIKVTIVDNFRNRIAAVEEVGWLYGGGATWEVTDKGLNLLMKSSGTSGVILFRTTNYETFAIAVGVHNYKRWSDIKTDLDVNTTVKDIIPDYYNNDKPEHKVREKQSATADAVTANKNSIKLNFTQAEGHDLAVDLIYRDGPNGAGDAGNAGREWGDHNIAI